MTEGFWPLNYLWAIDLGELAHPASTHAVLLIIDLQSLRFKPREIPSSSQLESFFPELKLDSVINNAWLSQCGQAVWTACFFWRDKVPFNMNMQGRAVQKQICEFCLAGRGKVVYYSVRAEAFLQPQTHWNFYFCTTMTVTIPPYSHIFSVRINCPLPRSLFLSVSLFKYGAISCYP